MLDKKTKKAIKEILFHFLNSKKDRAFIFGSRAYEKARKFSDIDIGIESRRKIPSRLIEQIEEAFEESELPYTVDIVNFAETSERFKDIAKQKVIFLN